MFSTEAGMSRKEGRNCQWLQPDAPAKAWSTFSNGQSHSVSRGGYSAPKWHPSPTERCPSATLSNSPFSSTSSYIKRPTPCHYRRCWHTVILHRCWCSAAGTAAAGIWCSGTDASASSSATIDCSSDATASSGATIGCCSDATTAKPAESVNIVRRSTAAENK